MIKKFILILVFFSLHNAFANGVVTLKQLDKKELSVGEAISLEVVSNKGLVSMEASAFRMQYILPYLFVDEIENEEGKIILKGFVTNSLEAFKPIQIHDKNILFNIENESIKKDPIELQEGFLLFSEKFISSIQTIYKYLIVALCVFLIGVFNKFFLPRIKKKQKWNKKQNILANKLKQINSVRDVEWLYGQRKEILRFFSFDKGSFDKLLLMIEEEQYKKNWDSGKLEGAIELAHQIKFEKRKYDRT